MKQIFLLAMVSVVLAFTNGAFAQRECRDLFSAPPQSAAQSAPMSKSEYVSKLIEAGVDQTAYVVKWHAIKESARGPFPESGEFVVSGVPWSKAGHWMEAVGENTIGLMVDGLPESNPGSAELRVGNRYYSYRDVRSRREDRREVYSLFYDVGSPRHYVTELTLTVTPEEKQAVLHFLAARQSGTLVAKTDIRGGAVAGEVIRPEFDIEKMGLSRESCAGACTSWFNPAWLKHYDAPEVLIALAERLELKPTPVAKQMIWGHVRRPGPMGITLFGIDRADIGETSYRMPNLMSDFIHNNAWLKLRGMPAYGYIPDPVSGATETILSQRIPLTTWLEQQGGGN